MATVDRPLAQLICRAGLATVLLTGVAAELRAQSLPGAEPASATRVDTGDGWRVHLGPPHRRGIEVGTLLSADSGRERLYAYVDLQERLPLPMRRVLRQADGGITVERQPATPVGAWFDGRPAPRTNLGSMMRWRLQGGSQMAMKLQAGKVGLQVVTPLTF